MPLPASRVKLRPVRFSEAREGLLGLPSLAGIYRIVCLPMKMAYVGQTTDFLRRYLEHRDQLIGGIHTNPRLQGAFRKFGPKAFVFQVLELYRGRWAEDAMTPAEQRWLDAHGRGSCFNVRPAGTDAWLELEIGGKPSSPRAKKGSKRTQGGDNRPLGRVPGAHDERDWRNRFPRKPRGRK